MTDAPTTTDTTTTDVDTTTEDTAPDAPDAPESAESVEEDQRDPEVRRARQEAQNLRKRLRDAEAERDTVAGALTTIRTAEAVRIAGEHLADGTDLLTFGTEVADLLTEAGTVDADKVRAAADVLLRTRPHLKRSKFGALNTGPQNLETQSPLSWGQALSGK